MMAVDLRLSQIYIVNSFSTSARRAKQYADSISRFLDDYFKGKD